MNRLEQMKIRMEKRTLIHSRKIPVYEPMMKKCGICKKMYDAKIRGGLRNGTWACWDCCQVT